MDTPLRIDARPDATDGSHKTGTLTGVTAKDINTILGFTPNVEDDPDKVKYSWGFMANDTIPCAIWDYKGSYRDKEFSTFGPAEIFEALFGSKFTGEEWP